MRIRGDGRGQSEVIGAILIFSIIVAMLGINQAFLVPQANQDVEFKHSQDVQRDMVDLRTATVEAAASNETRSRSIELGTNYPTRFIALNPPSPTGTFETQPLGEYESNIEDPSLVDICGVESSSNLDTKALQYESNYNEFNDALPMKIENTVTYRDAGKPLFSSGQVFVTGNEINIIRYTGDVRESSSGTESIDFHPSRTGGTLVENTDDTDLYITIPTELSETEWESIVDSEAFDDDAITDVGEKVRFDFNDEVFTIRCTTIGVNEQPDVSPINTFDDGQGSNRDGINPNQTGTVILKDTENLGANSPQGSASITFEDRTASGEDPVIEEARVNFYQSAEPGGSEEIPDNLTIGETDHNVGGVFEPLDDQITINDETEVTVTFNGADVQPNDAYMLTLIFSNGDTNTYFIAHPR